MTVWLVWCDDCESVVHQTIYLGLATRRAEDHTEETGHQCLVEESEEDE